MRKIAIITSTTTSTTPSLHHHYTITTTITTTPSFHHPYTITTPLLPPPPLHSSPSPLYHHNHHCNHHYTITPTITTPPLLRPLLHHHYHHHHIVMAVVVALIAISISVSVDSSRVILRLGEQQGYINASFADVSCYVFTLWRGERVCILDDKILRTSVIRYLCSAVQESKLGKRAVHRPQFHKLQSRSISCSFLLLREDVTGRALLPVCCQFALAVFRSRSDNGLLFPRLTESVTPSSWLKLLLSRPWQISGWWLCNTTLAPLSCWTICKRATRWADCRCRLGRSFHTQEWSISNHILCSLTRNLTSHSMKNLAFHSFTRLKDDHTTNSH